MLGWAPSSQLPFYSLTCTTGNIREVVSVSTSGFEFDSNSNAGRSDGDMWRTRETLVAGQQGSDKTAVPLTRVRSVTTSSAAPF